MPLFIVLSFPLILFAGYGAAYALSGRNAKLLVGPAGFLLYLFLLTIPFVAVLVARPDLPREVLAWRPGMAAWTGVGLVTGVALWGVQIVLPGRATTAADNGNSRVWIGPPGWIGFAVLMVPVACIIFAEELVWRGYLLREIGLPLSAAAFALHHYIFGLRHIVFAFLAGLAWGGLFMAADDLWPAVASHLAYNVLAWAYLRRSSVGTSPTG